MIATSKTLHAEELVVAVAAIQSMKSCSGLTQVVFCELTYVVASIHDSRVSPDVQFFLGNLCSFKRVFLWMHAQ